MGRSRASHSLLAGLAVALGMTHKVDAQDVKPEKTPALAFARHVPERFDDVAWENDRIAFRVYGPALEDHEKTGSGIDIWSKSTRALIIDRWYKSPNYHKDSGEGLDCYSVGQGRGCGGLGVWNGSSLDVSRVWASHKILESGPARAVIELTYAPWTSADRKVWEIRRISLEVGSNLNRVVSTLESDKPSELIVGIGISRRAGDEAIQDKAKGLLTCREPKAGPNGTNYCGVLIQPSSLLDFAETKGDRLALIKVTPGKPFVYYAGAGWSKGGDFPTAESWERYLRAFPARFSAD